ncbi:hypothetical protein Glove_229g79 [Diversispora epigaea]|uniref:TLDc domain-containing protein n=1 Tax=Diversispora epigaea TaxID=1348612 RepID=A0A397IL33_9GLOM|nr:hypothetical protein Glove_229g79 [Diversispora epigaea]
MPSTIVIIKVKGTDEILGGYNPLAWNANNGYGGQKMALFSHCKIAIYWIQYLVDCICNNNHGHYEKFMRKTDGKKEKKIAIREYENIYVYIYLFNQLNHSDNQN